MGFVASSGTRLHSGLIDVVTPHSEAFGYTHTATNGYLSYTAPYIIQDVPGASSSSVLVGLLAGKYGTYKVQAKTTAPAANNTCDVGVEDATQQNGCIFQNSSGAYYACCRAGGASTADALAGQNWTTEKSFKIVWILNNAKFYVDGVLVDTITVNVPATYVPLFSRSVTGVGGSACVLYHREATMLW